MSLSTRFCKPPVTFRAGMETPNQGRGIVTRGELLKSRRPRFGLAHLVGATVVICATLYASPGAPVPLNAALTSTTLHPDYSPLPDHAVTKGWSENWSSWPTGVPLCSSGTTPCYQQLPYSGSMIRLITQYCTDPSSCAAIIATLKQTIPAYLPQQNIYITLTCGGR